MHITEFTVFIKSQEFLRSVTLLMPLKIFIFLYYSLIKMTVDYNFSLLLEGFQCTCEIKMYSKLIL